MLAAMATILKSAVEAGLILLLFMMGLNSAGLNKQKKTVYFGLLLAAICAFVLVYGVDFFGDREVFEGYLSLAVLLTAGGCWLWIWRKFRSGRVSKVAALNEASIFSRMIVTMAIGILILAKVTEIMLFLNSIFLMSANLLNSEAVLKITGVLLALIITVIFVLIFLRLQQRITFKQFMFFSLAVSIVVILRQAITSVQVLFATGVLPLTSWAVNIIAPLINSYYPIFFYVLVGITLVLWNLLHRRVKEDYPDTESTVNPAQRRKLLAAFAFEKRWIKALGLCLFVVVLILGGDMAFANKNTKLEPPIPVSAQGGRILISLEQVNDGKLHRYSYMTPENVETRFIVIKKGENMFGTGLDACDICGQAGYYQRGKDVICKNCDVVINIPTIGFPGGCNPIPLKNSIDGSNLVISTAQLEQKQEVFQD